MWRAIGYASMLHGICGSVSTVYPGFICAYVMRVACRETVVEAPDPEQIRKDLERLEIIRKKRCGRCLH